MVSQVVPGLQAAFVDLGLDRAGFLRQGCAGPRLSCVAEARVMRSAAALETQLRPGIESWCSVVKDPLGSKGPGSAPRPPPSAVGADARGRACGVSQRIGGDRARPVNGHSSGAQGGGPRRGSPPSRRGLGSSIAADRRRLLSLWDRLEAAGHGARAELPMRTPPGPRGPAWLGGAGSPVSSPAIQLSGLRRSAISGP